jgi:hypothetical protein
MRSLLPVLLLFALGGCTDPFLRAGTWHPEGVNDANLRAMILDPRDLDRGASEPGTNGQLAAAAVTRLRRGNVKPLADSGISKIGASATPEASPTSAPGGT